MLPSEQLRLEVSKEQDLDLEQYKWSDKLKERILGINLNKEVEPTFDTMSEVYTSGFGTIKEKLYIGKVIKIDNDIYSKKIYVESKVDFNNLNYVLIVGDLE